MSDYLSQLNEQQRAAVEYLGGPQLVIAGAGSGKTRVLTYKIVHLLANGYEPGRIMALTFTNKAAREMRERIERLVGGDTARRLWMGTFHSLFSRILRSNAELLGFTRNYTIYDTDNSRSLIKDIIKKLELDDKVYKASTIQNNISFVKNMLYSPSDYAADKELMDSDRRAKRERTAEIYRIYASRCRKSDAMDFDDLLYYTAVLFRDHPEVLRHYREFFRYILVDEYQDTNFAQNAIMMQLTGGIGNICVVGDDAQSIYSFRGANLSNIFDLKKTFPNIETFKLEQNYRSTKNIINAANSLIEKNSRQIKKTIFSLNDEGERIEVQSGHSDYDEAGLVASRIVTRRATSGDPFSEFAILYRTNAQSRVLEESLRRRNIPYKIYGGLAFYQRKEVKDAISYFRLAINPRDDEALKRVINVPARSIGKTTVDKVMSAAIEHNISMWDVVTAPDKYGITGATQKKLAAFAALIEEFIATNDNGCTAEELANTIMQRTGLMAMYLSDHTPESISKLENLQELIRSVHDFVEDRLESEGSTEQVAMADFLAEVSLATDQDKTDPELAESVTLMTIHAAKGLEFSNIFVVGVEDQLLPSNMCSGSVDEVEEERRLFYVAITRAKKFCMLSYASSRFLNGQTMVCRPSRFLKDLNPAFLKYSYGADAPIVNTWRPQVATTTFTPARTPVAQPKSDVKNHSLSELSKGQRIVHSKFGEGTITDLIETNIGDCIIVKFDNEGQTEKKLLLKFAKFKILKIMRVENIPTPAYVVYEDRMRRNLALINDVKRRADVEIIMAFKANALWRTFDIVKEYCTASTASSINELRLGREFLGGNVHSYCPAYTDATIDEFMESSSHLTFNSLGQWEQFAQRVAEYNTRPGCKVSPGLRVNPRCSVIETDIYNPALPGSRFGADEKQLGEHLPNGIEGLHFHALCESTSYDLEKVLEAFEERFGKYLPEIKWVNMGGGHLMTRQGYDVEHLISVLKAFKQRYPWLNVILEPGSAFMWRTGDLLTSVVDIIKNDGISTAIIDASFACHMPDTLEMPYKPLISESLGVDAVDGKPTYRLGGNSCLSGDFMGDWSFNEALKAGDRLTLEDMNHYTTVKTNMFNGISHPSIWLVDMQGEAKELRRYTYEDYKSRMS